MTDYNNNSGGWYHHDNAENCIKFQAKVKMLARSHTNKDVIKILKGDTVTAADDRRVIAHADLYDIIIRQIANAQLIATLEQNHEDKGKNAFDYITGQYQVAHDENKQEAMDEDYIAKMCTDMSADSTSDDVRNHLTEMTTLRNTLNGTSFALSNSRHSRYMMRVVKRMSEAHRSEVRMLNWSDEVLDECPRVLGMLEGVAANVAKRTPAGGTAVKTDFNALFAQSTPDEIAAFFAKYGNRQRQSQSATRRTKCKKCGAEHIGDCYAWDIAMTGKDPDGMKTLPAASQTSIRARAEQIKDNDKKPLIAVAKPLGNYQLECHPAVVDRLPIPIKVDSQAGAGYPYHYIADMSIVIDKKKLPTPIVIGGIGKSKAEAEFIGTVAFVDEHDTTVVLENCLLAPALQHSLFSTSAALQRGVKTYLNHDNYVEWPSGQRVSFDNPKLAMLGRPLSKERALAVREMMRTKKPITTEVIDTLMLGDFETVQYGKDGKVHIDVSPMSATTRAEFELHSARLNDPSAERLRKLHKIADGAAPILRKANLVNTASAARLLANPVQSPSKPGTTPVPQKPGQRTEMDIASGPIKSIIGNKYILGVRDGASSNFRIYPMKTKDQAVAAQNQYYLDAKALGVDIDGGGVLHSDNEIVLNSEKMDDMAAQHNQTRSNSNEYEPTGNPAETIFRVLWPEMRKNVARSGLPQEFWDFNALDCEVICRDTRVRDGDTTPGELFTGKRADVSKRKVWGCLVYAQIPAPWRQHKQSARGVEGVNLGKCRTKPGYWVWSPEVGLFTTKHITWRETRFPFKDGTFVWNTKTAPATAPPGTGGGGMDSTFMPDLPRANDGDDEGTEDDGDDDGGYKSGYSESGESNDDASAASAGQQHAVGMPVQAIPGMGAYQGDSDSSSDSDTAISHGTLDDPHGNSHSSDPDYQPEVDVVEVLASAVKTAKMKREQKASGIPPPWMGLNNAPDHIKQVFMEAEMEEINGILDGAAYEKAHKELPPGTKVYDTLTLRDKKKNGPKKGKAKVRVCVKKGPKDVESHSPTLQMPTLRAILALLAAKKAKGAAGDFPQAYLNADQEIYYVWPPKTARQYDEQGNRLVWALPKALYGGRASGRHWYKMLRKWFTTHGFRVSEWDPCLFIKVDTNGNFHYVGLYVDDLIHVYSDEEAYKAVIEEYRKDFRGYSELPLTEIFNAEVSVTDKFVTLTQTRYIETLQEKFLEGENVSATRTPAHTDLEDIVKKAAETGKAQLSAEEHAKYREIVGAILYIATVSRPDVAVAVGLLSRVLEYPNAATLEAAYRVLRYLITTKVLGLRWTVGGDTTLSGMSDANWAVVKSTSGYVFFLCQAAIAFIAKKQIAIAMSSTEAEIMAASLAALEAVFLRGILSEMLCVQKQPTVIGIDNQGAVALAKNYISNSRTKHIECRHLKIRELVEEMMVLPEFVPTDENVADIMTKPLGRAKFEKFRKILLNHEV